MARPALYERIGDELRRRIADGDLAPGDKLPTEHDLCAEWSTSRTTVRNALALLVDEGLVISHGSAGWFVRRVRPRTMNLGTGSETADPLSTPGIADKPRTVVTISVPLAGDVDVRGRRLADLLDGVTENDGVIHRSVLHLDGLDIVGVADAYAPESVVTGESGVPAFRSRKDGDPIAMFRAAGRNIAEVVEISAARQPTQQIAERLELRPGTPVMHLLRLVRFAPDRVCRLVIHQMFPGAGAEFVRVI